MCQVQTVLIDDIYEKGAQKKNSTKVAKDHLSPMTSLGHQIVASFFKYACEYICKIHNLKSNMSIQIRNIVEADFFLLTETGICI